MAKNDSKKTVVSTRLDADLVKRLKHLGVDTDKKINELLEEGIALVLKKYKA